MQGRDDRRSMAAPGLGSRNPYRVSRTAQRGMLGLTRTRYRTVQYRIRFFLIMQGLALAYRLS
jgi:hypothetical protein